MLVSLALVNGRTATLLVALQVEFLDKSLLAVFTLEGFLAPVHADVCLHVLEFSVEATTIVARQDLVLPEGLHVAYVYFLVSSVGLVLLLAAVCLECPH